MIGLTGWRTPPNLFRPPPKSFKSEGVLRLGSSFLLKRQNFSTDEKQMNFSSLSLKQLLSFTDVKWRQQCLSYPLGEKGERRRGWKEGAGRKGYRKRERASREKREKGGVQRREWEWISYTFGPKFHKDWAKQCFRSWWLIGHLSLPSPDLHILTYGKLTGPVHL